MRGTLSHVSKSKEPGAGCRVTRLHWMGGTAVTAPTFPNAAYKRARRQAECGWAVVDLFSRVLIAFININSPPAYAAAIRMATTAAI